MKRSQVPTAASYRHIRGVHCVTTALRSLLHHFTGEKWSEGLCFGLGSGLNFTYVRERGAPFFLIMGRGSYVETHFCDALGIRLESYRSDDPVLGWEYLRSLLDRGTLAMVDADMFCLGYLVQALGLMDGVHFGGHKLVVPGYDPEEGRVLVCDYAWQEPWSLTIDQLQRARSSTDCPSPPRNACFTFHFPDGLPPLSHAIPWALETTVRQMRHPFLPVNGLPAVDRFCRQVARWGRIFDEEDLRVHTALTAFMLEKAGTGGGNFRNLHHRFLSTAADLIGAPELLRVAAVYKRLAVAWREVAGLLEESLEDPGGGLYAPGGAPQRLLDEIALLEHQGIADTEAFVRGAVHSAGAAA